MSALWVATACDGGSAGEKLSSDATTINHENARNNHPSRSGAELVVGCGAAFCFLVVFFLAMTARNASLCKNIGVWPKFSPIKE